MFHLRLFGFILFACLALPSTAQFYNGLNMKFGKNRVQYSERFWFYYQMDRYNIYHYAGGEQVAEYTALTAHKTMKALEKQFDFYSSEKVYFVIYNKLSDFRQSNIGLSEDDGSKTGGVTRISGSKIFLYFEGDYTKLNEQIKGGLAQITLGKMMFGENWKEVIKNSALLNIPDWYLDGIVSYATTPWNVEIDNRVRDGIMSGRYEKFNRLSKQDAAFAGHALWNYIAEVHGAAVIPNILYMSRVSRSIESGFLFVLGISLNTLIEESLLHYKVRYELDEEQATKPSGEQAKIRSRKRWIYDDWTLNVDGTKGAYSANRLGKYKIFIYDFSKRKKKKIYRKGYKLDRINDYRYPHLAWHPNGEILSFITEDKAANTLHIYDLNEKKQFERPIFQLEEVLDYSYSPDGTQLVLSAVKKGQSDLFLLNIASNSQVQLTNDLFDDSHPEFLQNGQIIFASNRLADTLPEGKIEIKNANKAERDLFVLQPKGKEWDLSRFTLTSEVNEVQPEFYKGDQFVFLSDENGIRNRYLGIRDSAILSIDTAINYRYFTISEPITNYNRNIEVHDIVAPTGIYGEMILEGGRYKFFKGDLAADIEAHQGESELRNTQYKDLQGEQKQDVEKKSESITYTSISVFENFTPDNPNVPKDSVYNSNLIDINNYVFEDEPKPEAKKNDSPKFIKLKPEAADVNADSVYLPQRRNYNLNFTAVDLTTAVDFDYATELYQPFNGGPYTNPGSGALLKVGMEDLFEDYLVEGGGRFGFNGTSNEFFLALDDRSRRLDRKYIIQRQTLTNVSEFVTNGSRSIIHQGRMILGYPINEVLALNTTLTYRNDRIVELAIDNRSLQSPDLVSNWGGFKTELVFDNTRDVMENVMYGTRFKLFYEFYGQIGQESGDISIAGFDFRHYQEIHRELIFAFRAAGSTSFGSRKLVYYMGAVDNWFTITNREKFDQSIPIAQDQNYYWQTIATNMRGFVQNARNGNSFAVINHELRWPAVKYFARKPLKNQFFSNLMLTGFFDIGTAWTGPNPYSDENAFNTIEIPGNPVTVRIDNKRNPIIGAYGAGLRSKLFGYYLRLDYGWGVEDQIIQDPMIHLSAGLDF